MHKLAAVAILLGLVAAALPEPADAKVDDRWALATRNGAPEATYMDADKKNVVFSATCDPAAHILTLEYAGEKDTPLTVNDPPLEFVVSGKTIGLDTHFRDGKQVGTLKLKAATAALFSGNVAVEINAANQMDEPWYVGQAAPLKQLVKGCGV